MAKPRRIYTNGSILTMDTSIPAASALAAAGDGRIIAVGGEDEVMSLRSKETEVVNLGGRTVVPGFFDCHMHILWLGENLLQVDLSSPPVTQICDIVRLLSERRDLDPAASCIQGNRYDQNKLVERRHPDRTDLDAVSTTKPVRIVHTSGHAAVVNSYALAALGIDRNTPDPPGGQIVKDPSGEPTGVLLETASWSNLERIIPPLQREDALRALGLAESYLLSRGITSATDANTEPDDIGLFRDAVLRRKLRLRTNLMVAWASVCAQQAGGMMPEDLQPEGVTWHELHVGQAKLFSDGAITTRTCWLTEPFEGMPDCYGIPMHSEQDLQYLVACAHDKGWQVATHAIGDRAVDAVLDAYAAAQAHNTRRLPGHRIEHCMLLDSNHIARLRRQKVWSIGQPEFIANLGDAYVSALGEERANRLSPYASLEQGNVAQAFSSDCPVVPGAPLAGIRAAARRQTSTGLVLNRDECISVESALYGYTSAPAYATRTDRDRGSLSAGKFADFAVLNVDLTADPADWQEDGVAATVVGGECLYGRDNLN